jgi:hypothetical protein
MVIKRQTILSLCFAPFVVVACEGLDGPIGPAGEDGVEGAEGMYRQPGFGGESCWDVSGDGISEVPGEDINTDGNCDYLECQGDPGLKGPARRIAALNSLFGAY